MACLGKYFSSHTVSINVKILAVFKLLKVKIAFVDFLQIEAAFVKTNYITFSYLSYQWEKYEGTLFLCGRRLLDIYPGI